MKRRFTLNAAINGLLLTAILLSFAPRPAEAKAQPAMGQEAEQLLVGKWRQQYGPFISETVYLANGRFTSITTGGVYRFYCEGRWEIRQGMLITYFEDWWPRVRMPGWEGTPIRFLDENRFQNKLGIAYRAG